MTPAPPPAPQSLEKRWGMYETAFNPLLNKIAWSVSPRRDWQKVSSAYSSAATAARNKCIREHH